MGHAHHFLTRLDRVSYQQTELALRLYNDNRLLTARTNAARATIDYYMAAAELARARGVDIPLPPTRPTTR